MFISSRSFRETHGLLPNEGTTQDILKSNPPAYGSQNVRQEPESNSQQNSSHAEEDEEAVRVAGFDHFETFSTSRYAILCSFMSLILYYLVAVVTYAYTFHHLTVSDALYFATVTLTTTGYGDLSPDTDAEIIFTIFFILFGVLILATVALEILFENMFGAYDQILEEAKEKSHVQFIDRIEEHTSTEIETSSSSPRFTTAYIVNTATTVRNQHIQDAHKNVSSKGGSMCFELAMEVTSLIPLIVLMLIGAFIIGYFEKWSYLRSIYFMVVTATTVGYGDVSPASRPMRLFCVFYIPFAIGIMGRLFGRISGVYLARKKEKDERDFMNHRLTAADIDRMDSNGDGVVTSDEFVRFMLVSMGKVTHEDLDRLQALFDKLDRVKDGQLDKDDIMKICE